MKDKEPKLEEIESSHTLGAIVIHTQIRQSRGLRQTMSVWVVITETPPVYNHSRGGGEWGGCGLKRPISVVMNTQIRQSRGFRQTMTVWVVITDAPVYMRYRGKWEREECGFERAIPDVIHTVSINVNMGKISL